MFIHTGRTGGMSRTICSSADGIEIVSGQRLLALLTGAPFEPDGLPSRDLLRCGPSDFRDRIVQ
jgi:restriction system protein